MVFSAPLAQGGAPIFPVGSASRLATDETIASGSTLEAADSVATTESNFSLFAKEANMAIESRYRMLEDRISALEATHSSKVDGDTGKAYTEDDTNILNWFSQWVLSVDEHVMRVVSSVREREQVEASFKQDLESLRQEVFDKEQRIQRLDAAFQKMSMEPAIEAVSSRFKAVEDRIASAASTLEATLAPAQAKLNLQYGAVASAVAALAAQSQSPAAAVKTAATAAAKQSQPEALMPSAGIPQQASLVLTPTISAHWTRASSSTPSPKGAMLAQHRSLFGSGQPNPEEVCGPARLVERRSSPTCQAPPGPHRSQRQHAQSRVRVGVPPSRSFATSPRAACSGPWSRQVTMGSASDDSPKGGHAQAARHARSLTPTRVEREGSSSLDRGDPCKDSSQALRFVCMDTADADKLAVSKGSPPAPPPARKALYAAAVTTADGVGSLTVPPASVNLRPVLVGGRC